MTGLQLLLSWRQTGFLSVGYGGDEQCRHLDKNYIIITSILQVRGGLRIHRLNKQYVSMPQADTR